MTSGAKKGLLVAAAQLALVSSLGVKLLIDRATYPRVWARAAPVDPELPIRGRYVSLRLEVVPGPGLDLPLPHAAPDRNGRMYTPPAPLRQVHLEARDGQLVALPAGPDGLLAHARQRETMTTAELYEPVAYFIPDGVPDPSRYAPGEELWVEVTIPPNGPPRPIQLSVRRAP